MGECRVCVHFISLARYMTDKRFFPGKRFLSRPQSASSYNGEIQALKRAKNLLLTQTNKPSN